MLSAECPIRRNRYAVYSPQSPQSISQQVWHFLLWL